MRVLITGGAGFLGSHICDFLIGRGIATICVDNLITGQISNIEHLTNNDNFEFLRHDITEPLQINRGIDYVLHFASPASPPDYLMFPIETLKAGSLGTLNALNLAREKEAKFLLASTSEVYGDPLENPQKEEYWGNVNPVGPRSVYDEAKRFSEASTMAYHRHYKIDTRIARIFNTYGPRMRMNDGRAIPTFIVQALNNEPLTVFGDGYQTRSFCFVSDLVKGIYKLMLSDTNTPINLGNSAEMTILDLAKRILKITGSKSEIVFRQLPDNDPKVRQPSLDKAHKILGWSPEVDLQDGLKETISWLRDSLAHSR